MTIEPVAIYRGLLPEKFGLPRQSGLAGSLPGEVILLPPYNLADAVRGLEGFSRLWLIWEFSKTPESDGPFQATVRPPRLGGNKSVGVFASRSPFRPNRLGLSCVQIESIEMHPEKGPVIHVLGADLMDGTPIFDIKPYIPYADAFPEADEGFTATPWESLSVSFSEGVEKALPKELLEPLSQLLSQDPRPAYQATPERVYRMEFGGYLVSFTVEGKKLLVKEVKRTKNKPKNL